MRLTPFDATYPEALRGLSSPPDLTVSGPLEARTTVAVVGSRHPLVNMERFAHDLARALARAGATIVSGGARGIDRAAHAGAIEGGGATWVVCGTGRARVFPPEHAAFFEEIEASPRGRVIWPFDDDVDASAETFRARNGVLVALADAVVVIQAKLQSGSRNAASWARTFGRPLWVVPGLPWSPYVERFGGSSAELRKGARPLTSMAELFDALELTRESSPAAPRSTSPPSLPLRGVPGAERPRSRKKEAPRALPKNPSEAGWSDDEKTVFSNLYLAPIHIDQIVAKAGIPVGAAMTALLTLSMKDVVVEGPDGFFRRRMAR